MADLTERGYLDADAPALTELLNLLEARAGGHPALTVEDVRSVAATWVRDHRRDARMIFADDRLVAAALIGTPPEGGFRVDTFAGVHPDWQGRGLGRDLVAWQRSRATEIHEATAPETEWALHFGANAEDDGRIRLFRRAGLKPVRYWFEMVAHTAAAPAIEAPAGLLIREYRPPDARTLHEAHMEAFRDHWGFQYRGYDAWAQLTVANGSFRPELSRLALDGDELAGYVLSYDDTQPDRGYIGQVGVRPPWRRRGLAAALLSAVLRASAGAGLAMVGLGVDADSPTGAVGVYERAGFAVESRSVTYATALPATRPAVRQPS